MSRIIIKTFARYISILLINAIFASGIAFASEAPYICRSTLSPRVSINAAEFFQGFQNRFALDIALLRKRDKIDERKDFAKDFYKLSFQTLFPKAIQSLLVNGIKSNILSSSNLKDIKSIDVEFKETEAPFVNQAYKYFKNTGPGKLNDLVDNAQLIDFLLNTIEGKRIDMVGFHPPRYKTESGKKKRDNYLRKWYANSIAAVKGEPVENFLKFQPWLLRKLYHRYILVHRFGEELRKSFVKGSAATFLVTITQSNGISVTEELTLSKKENQIIVRSSADREETNDELTLEGGSEFLFGDLDASTRKQLHILSDQNNLFNHVSAFQTTVLISSSILKALEILSNKKELKLIQADRRQIEKLLSVAMDWAKRTLKKGGVQEKKRISKLLEKIITSEGQLKKGDTKLIIPVLEKIAGLIGQRMKWLVERIQWRNNIILARAINSKDKILYSEGLKNKIVEIQGHILLNQIEQARIALSFFERALLSEQELYGREDLGKKLRDISNTLEQVDLQQTPEQALALIEEIDFYVKQQADNLRSIYKWFTDRGFDRYNSDTEVNYTAILNQVIEELDFIQTPGRKYLEVLNSVISKIDTLGKAINLHAETSRKIVGVQKQILPRLRGVRKALMLNRRKVLLRNAKLKQMQERSYRFADVNDAKAQLKLAVQVNRATRAYSQLLEKIHEGLNTLYLQVQIVQQNIPDQRGPQSTGKVEKQKYMEAVNELVLQAI